MDFGKAFKIFQFNILQQSGIAVTPEQFGLKPDAIPGFGGNNFSNVLGQLSGKAPTAPTPPEDPSDLEAQAEFNKEMVAYNQKLYAQNQQFLRQIMFQMSQLQRAAQLQSQQSQQSTGPQFERFGSSSGVGGILEGDTGL